MHVNDSLAPVEFLEHRLVSRVAEPFVAVAALQADPVGLQVSKAYSIALRVASTSSIDSVANRPKRPVWSRIISAAYSLHARASRPASDGPRSNHTPGVEASDRMPAPTPFSSMSSISLLRVQAT